MRRSFGPAGPLRGTLRPPPDKSISHRAALIGAIAGGTRIDGYLDAEDTMATLAALSAVGAAVDHRPQGDGRLEVSIDGPGLRGPTGAEIDVGNAGTLMRIMPGWLSGQEAGKWTLDGDASIRRRPVDRIVEPLLAMGARVECRDGRLPPLSVRGATLSGIEYSLPVASAQVKSCLLLAGLLASGETAVLEPVPSRDHTERMLIGAGAEVESDGRRISVRPAEELSMEHVAVPGDVSSSAFALVAALLVPGSEVELAGVGLNPTRTGLLAILRRMGADVEVSEATVAVEPEGSIGVRASQLRATEVGGDEVPLAIDELPLVALAACFAEGTTVIRDAAELRHKESDRIAAVCAALRAIGGDAESAADGMTVRGSGGVRGGSIDAAGDHRLAMLGAVAGVASRDGVEVSGFEAAQVSYPGFERDLGSLLE